MKLALFILGILLIIVHGFWSSNFLVDYVTIGILLIIFLPYLAHYLTKAKILGAEFEFKDKIKQTKETVQLSIEKTKKDKKFGKYKASPFETFETTTAKKILELEADHSLSLASLRMEIERKLRMMADFLDLSGRDKMPLFKIIEALGKKMMLSSEQMRALREIIILCNKAIHGYFATKEETEDIISLVDKLNKSFSTGYSISLSPNLNYKKHGLVCEWEHCIEWMSLTEKSTEKSCRLFGHNCPGGAKKVKICGKTINDFPKKRFVK